jgi:hypothetical protein
MQQPTNEDWILYSQLLKMANEPAKLGASPANEALGTLFAISTSVKTHFLTFIK